MTVLVQVEVEVDCEKTGMEVNKTEVNKVEASVKEAIRECLQRGEEMGFNHPLADKTSWGIFLVYSFAFLQDTKEKN